MPTTVGEGTQTHTLMHWLCGEHVFGGARAHRQAILSHPYEHAAARQFCFFYFSQTSMGCTLQWCGYIRTYE